MSTDMSQVGVALFPLCGSETCSLLPYRHGMGVGIRQWRPHVGSIASTIFPGHLGHQKQDKAVEEDLYGDPRQLQI